MNLAEIELKKQIRDAVDEELEIEEEKNEKRAFFVTGVEGSGTNMLTEALVAAGCHWEQFHEGWPIAPIGTPQAELFAWYRFDEMPSPFVMHRSIPHAGVDIHCSHFPDELRKYFRVHILSIHRDPYVAAMSVCNRDPERDFDKTLRKNHYAMHSIGGAAGYNKWDYTPITYEAFVGSEGFRRWLFEERLGLPFPKDFEVYDGNAKYYS